MNTSRTLDLGELKSPLLIFGGCYSNLQATKALQNWAKANSFEAEQCICTGDIVAYCGNPFETVELIRDWGIHCIQGNVEQSLATKADDCGCGFEAGTVCDLLSRGWYPFADSAVSPEQREWFKQLPEHLSFTIEAKSFQVVHGAPSDVSRFMFLSQSDNDFLDEISLLDDTQQTTTDVVIAGHSGLPFTKEFSDIQGKTKQWHNSGVLGMPANDGTEEVWFSTLDVKDGELNFTHHQLEYDVDATVEEMLKNNLTQGYHQALKTGLWPSMDVLPEFEKSQQGIRQKSRT